MILLIFERMDTYVHDSNKNDTWIFDQMILQGKHAEIVKLYRETNQAFTASPLYR